MTTVTDANATGQVGSGRVS